MSRQRVVGESNDESMVAGARATAARATSADGEWWAPSDPDEGNDATPTSPGHGSTDPVGTGWAPPTGDPGWAPPTVQPGWAPPPDGPNGADRPEGPFANPWIAAAAVFGVGAVVSSALWDVLALPGDLISDAFANEGQLCTDLRVGTSEMYWCSLRYGLIRSIGPILISIALLVFRRQIGSQIRNLTPRLPRQGRFLVSPVLATAMFTMVFGALHADSGGSGYLPQRMFPAVIGLMAHLMPAGGRWLAARAPSFFDARDKFPVIARLALALLIPFAVSYLTTRNSSVVANEVQAVQRTVLLGASAGWLALVPRGSGSLATVVRSFRRFR